jgi:N-acetylmuramoyl-L-alanine amidase
LIARKHRAQTIALRTAAGFALFIACFAGNALAVKYGSMRSEPVDMIVIHSTGGPTCDEATGKPVWVKAGSLDEDLRNIEANPKLGIHYMIDRDGTVRTSVPEDRFANHVFTYSGRSIAIELVNDGDGHDPFPKAQIDALVKLLKDITRRRGIVREGIKRHSDLDHGMLWCDRKQRRKVDPGAAFPFQAVLDRVFKQDR